MMRRVNHVGMSYCWMSCLQYHQLTGTHKGVGIDVSKLLVASQEPKSEGETERGIKYVSGLSFFFGGVNLLLVIVSPPVTHNLCIFVPLKASLATSLMPFLVSRLSLEREAKLTVMWLQHRTVPTVNLSELSKLILVCAVLLFSLTKAVRIHRTHYINCIYCYVRLLCLPFLLFNWTGLDLGSCRQTAFCWMNSVVVEYI